MAPKTRETRSSAPTPSPAPSTSKRGVTRSVSRSRSRSARTKSTEDPDGPPQGAVPVTSVETVQEEDEPEEEEEGGVEEDGEEENQEDGEEDEGGQVANDHDDDAEEEEEDVTASSSADKGKGKPSMEDRLAKMKELRLRMNQSTAANRKDLVADHQKRAVSAKELSRLEKQRKMAQTLRLKEEAEANGTDLQRQKAWEWTIEQDERWQAKLDAEKEKGDSRFHNAEDAAHKKYNRDIRATKADLLSYERQKEAALGLAPGKLVPAGASSSSLAARSGGARGLSAAEDLYRGADTLSYGDSKPSEDAIDRVSAKINKDMDGGKKRNRKTDRGGDDSEVNYINDRNKVFNRKIARYFDKYTKEIRANFERGTAL